MKIHIKFVTRIDTKTEEFARSFFEVITKRHPRLTPESFDTKPERECKKPFVDVNSSLRSWAWRNVIQVLDRKKVVDEVSFIGQNYLKKKKDISYFALVDHSQNNRYGNPIFGRIAVYIKIKRNVNWLVVFRDLTQVIKPTLARMHIFTDLESYGFTFDSPNMGFIAGPSQPEMRDGLTNLGWANVFSEEYAEEVDAERLRAHGFAVEDVPGGKLFTVTDNLFDIVDDFEKFSRRRAELKSLFRPGLFRITDEPIIPTT